MGVNKIALNTADGEMILIDLTMLTVKPETLTEGVIAINAEGELIVGTHKCGGGGSNTSHFTDAVLGSAKLGSAVLWSNTRLGAVALGETKLGG